MSTEDIKLAQRVIDFLNELVAIDREAVEKLIETRVPCNQALTDHPTVQVSCLPGQQHVVGMLGILNGLVGAKADGWGYIMADFDNTIEPMKLIKFRINRV